MADKSSLFVEGNEGKERIVAAISLRNALQRYGAKVVLEDLKDLDLDAYEKLVQAVDTRNRLSKPTAAIFKDPFFGGYGGTD